MKTYTIQLLKEEAKNILEQLQKLEIIRFIDTKTVKSFDKKFDAFRIDTKGYKFNREEANER